MRVRLVLISSLLVILLGTGTAKAAVKMYESSEAATFLGEFRKGKCKVKRRAGGKVFHAASKSTNGTYTLDVSILDFKGFGPEYTLPYGQIATTVDVEGVNSPVDFSNAFPFPGSQPPPGGAGAIAFARRGAKLGLGVYALPNSDYSQGVVLAGGLKCAYPR